MKGIDCSEHNGNIDWDAVKEAGIEFVIVRCSYGLESKDTLFEHNVEEAHKRGIMCAAYHYSYALNELEAKQEADNCRKVIDDSGVLLELPVFFDMEDADGYKLRNGFAFDSDEITSMCRAFKEHLGLHCGIYASESWLNDYIDWKSLECPVWCASWCSPKAYSFSDADGECDGIRTYIWQFTDMLQIGYSYFDGNIMYDKKDKAGQNGY